MRSFESKTFQLTVNDLVFNIERYGKGKRHIFYFHGYGQKSNSVNNILSDSFLEHYTIHSVGLFFHESKFPSDRLPKYPFESLELVSFINTYAKLHFFEEYYLMGYSIGARMCFDLLLHLKIKGLFVIAPDGITRNIWQTLFTQSAIVNSLALSLVRHTSLSVAIITFLQRVGLVSAYEMRLVQNNIHSAEVLENVFNVWICYSKIYPSFKKWISVLKESNVPHYFLFGKKDRIITNRAALKVMKHFNSVELVDDGHDLIKEKYSGKISDFFLNISE